MLTPHTYIIIDNENISITLISKYQFFVHCNSFNKKNSIFSDYCLFMIMILTMTNAPEQLRK